MYRATTCLKRLSHTLISKLFSDAWTSSHVYWKDFLFLLSGCMPCAEMMHDSLLKIKFALLCYRWLHAHLVLHVDNMNKIWLMLTCITTHTVNTSRIKQYAFTRRASEIGFRWKRMMKSVRDEKAKFKKPTLNEVIEMCWF